MALLLNHFAAVGLLFAYLSPYVSPESFWLIAFFGLAYPLLVLINLVFVMYWALQWKKNAFYSLLLILSGYSYINSYVQLEAKTKEYNPEKGFKLMSYNVKLFDLYNWSHNRKTRGKMFDLIKSENPDILCLQEFYSSETIDEYRFNNMDSLMKFEKSKYSHVEYTTTLRKKDHWGMAIFSSYPIVKNGKINFETKSNNACIYSDILMGRDTIRVYNVHLQSIKFDYGDYQFVDDLMNNKETEEIEKSKNILKRIRRAYIARAKQTELVAAHMAICPYPIIICGDFNDTPASHTYQTISKDMKDCFIESGKGLGRTYVGKFPSFRIDYILHSNQFNSYNFNTLQKDYSDHYPLVSYLEKI